MDTQVKIDTYGNRFFYPAVIISALFLLIPAFYNHYPLVNPDTATYLASGFKPETPFDRPITYGLLIRLFSINGLSLWLVVFAQAYILSWLVFKITKHIATGRSYLLKASITILLLSLGSAASWLASQVQPDVFTSIAFLCVILLFMNREAWASDLLLYVLFFLSVAVHLSHPLLFTISLVCMLFLKRSFTEKGAYGKINKKILILIMLSLASIAIMGPALSKSKHVFFIGSLLEKGVLKKYLDDNCATSNYKICAYKDSLPKDANEFWWDNTSPLYKIGDWKGTKPEFNDIIHNILTTPEYLSLYMQATAKQSWQQACTFNIGDGNVSFPTGTNVNQRVAEYFPGEVNRFNNDKQNAQLHFSSALTMPNTIFLVVFLASLAALVFVFIRRRQLTNDQKFVFIICLLAIILNCLDCAAFGTVNGRYGCKMIWLLPFCIILYFTNVSKKISK